MAMISTLQSITTLCNTRDLPTEMFVAHIVQEYAGSEIDLDTTRLLFFDAIKSNDDFPFDVHVELKCTFVFVRRGDHVALKLAHDIHTLLAIM